MSRHTHGEEGYAGMMAKSGTGCCARKGSAMKGFVSWMVKLHFVVQAIECTTTQHSKILARSLSQCILIAFTFTIENEGI